MKKQKVKKIRIKAQDFSNRKYFPGTPNNPFHEIEKILTWLNKVPTPLYSCLLGGLLYLISGNPYKAIALATFSILDWILLSLLPVFHISFGPPLFTTIVLALMRMPFFIFLLPYAIVFQIIGTTLVVYGFYIEPQFPKATKYTLRFPVSQSMRQPIRIVHFSDLHLEYLTKREKRVIEIVNEIAPDLILFTGDFFNLSFQQNPETFQEVIQFFKAIHAKEGVFGVTGSPSVDLDESINTISSEMPLKLLNDECIDLNINGLDINLIGLGCTHQPSKDINRLEPLLKKGQYDLRILLYHSPDIAPAIESLPIDLQLSGHTHGGQVQLPVFGPIYTNSLYGLQFSSGLYQVNDSPYLILSRGLGFEGLAIPRVRFLSPPEVGLITLEFLPDNVQ